MIELLELASIEFSFSRSFTMGAGGFYGTFFVGEGFTGFFGAAFECTAAAPTFFKGAVVLLAELAEERVTFLVEVLLDDRRGFWFLPSLEKVTLLL